MDTTEKAFQYASESSKLLITLSTGIIAFMITFLDKVVFMKPGSMCEKVILIVAWVIFLGSAIVGVWTQLALTDILEPKTKSSQFKPTIRSRKVKVPFQIQAITFISGIIMIVIYGCLKMFFD